MKTTLQSQILNRRNRPARDASRWFPTSLRLPASLAVWAGLAVFCGFVQAETNLVVDINPHPGIFECSITATQRDVTIQGTNVHALVYRDDNAATWPAGSGIPVPLMNLKVGDLVICHFQNTLPAALYPEGASIHWHGIELDNDSDGTAVTQDSILEGQSYVYRFRVTRPGLFWFHSHMVPGNETFAGMYGAIVIPNPIEPALRATNALPPLASTYTLALSDIDFNTNGFVGKFLSTSNAWFTINRLALICHLSAQVGARNTAACGAAGLPGSKVLVNGMSPDTAPITNNVPSGQRVRLRLMNESISRHFRLKLIRSNGTQIDLYRIGGQGGLLNHPVREGGLSKTSSGGSGWNTGYNEGEMVLAPGVRADTLARILGTNGEIIRLVGNPLNTAGGPGYKLSSSLPTDYPIAYFRVTGAKFPADPAICECDSLLEDTAEDLDPKSLESDIPVPLTDHRNLPGTNDPVIHLKSTIPTGPGVFMDQEPTIDGFAAELEGNEGDGAWLTVATPPTARYAYVGDLIELTVTNETEAVHPFHLHGFSFQPVRVIGSGGTLYTFDYTEFVDTLDVFNGQALVFRVKLEDREKMCDGAPSFPPGPVLAPCTAAGTGGARGRWVYHCHIFSHAGLGMISELNVLEPTDFGDAPPPYPTLLANNGARHLIAPGLHLGISIDREVNGPDDSPLADEDGVTFLAPVIAGRTAFVLIEASAPGLLDAFLDFNGDGDWNDPAERITLPGGTPLTGGPNPLSFPVPAGASIGNTFARFRFSTAGGLDSTGPAPDGEVEDYPLQVQTPPDLGLAVVLPLQPVTDTSNFTYSITVTNQGGTTATSTMLALPLPAGLTYTAVTSSQGTCSNGPSGVQCNLGTVPANGVAMVVVVGIPDFNLLTTLHSIPAMQEVIRLTNSVSVSSAETDANPVDNAAELVVAVAPLRDFGDASDPPYPTMLPTGARHRLSALRFGTLIDAEPNGQPTNQDDTIGVADEIPDGIGLLAGYYPGGLMPITFQVNGPAGYIDLWVDLDGVPGWGASDHVLSAAAHPGGGAAVGWAIPIPVGTAPGAVWARARVHLSPAGLPPDGYGGRGEVVDFPVNILAAAVDLAVVAAPTAVTVTEGDSFTTTIAVTNRGPSTATSVRLSATLPSGVPVASITSTLGGCQVEGSNIVCTVPSLPAQQSFSVTLTANSSLLPEDLASEFFDIGTDFLVSASEPEVTPGDNQLRLPIAIAVQRDFGDAPVPTYPTLLPNAARHRIGALRFGTLIDAELNGQPVDLDDAAGVADEVTDGFGLPAGGIYAGGWTPINIQVSGAVGGYIDLWIDVDGTPGWGPADHVVAAFFHPGGGAVVAVPLAIPPGAAIGPAWARARVHKNPAGLPPTGFGGFGEVVDFQINILSAAVDLAAWSNPAEMTVTEGEPLTLTVTVTNKGPSTATAVTGMIHFPPGATLEALQLSQGTGQMEGTNLVCQFGIVPPHGSATVTFTAGTTAIFEDQADEFMWFCFDYFSAEIELTPEDNMHHGAVGVVAARDFGDAPDATVGPAYAYPTRLVDDGARHRVAGPYFGGSPAGAAQRDRDPDGMPTVHADGDDVSDANDDEEGIQILDPIYPGATGVRARINAPLGGSVDAWIDFDRNGRWGMGAPEQIFTSLPVTPGTFEYTFNVPAGAVVGSTHARFRISSTGGLAFTGYATNGEVEDLTVNIQPSIDLNVAVLGNPTVQIDEDAPYSLLLRVSNKGSNTATGAQLSATLPEHLTVESITITNGSCQLDGNIVTCQMTSLPSGQDSIIGVLIGLLTGAAETLPGDELTDFDDLDFLVSSAELDRNPADNLIAVPALVFFARDWGDAPSGYPVMNVENGPRHRRKAGFFFGTGWDREANGTHSAGADFDDLNGFTPDDEDGITFSKPVAPGAPAYVTVQSSAAGFLDAWADFNGDGDWADAGEQIFSSQPLVAGANPLTFNTPSTAKAGVTFSRWRLSETGGLTYTGFGGKGEVEDHQVTVHARLDFGDAPEFIPATTYEVTLSRDGARHEPSGLLLGTAWDAEIDGQPSTPADRDDLTGVPDDEDGWTPVPFVAGTMMNLSVYVTGGNGVLDVWVDWDHNYNWDAPEHQVVAYPVVPGVNLVPINVPVGIPTGQTYARFRLSTAGCTLPSGYAADGEVEDYLVTVNNGGNPNPNPVYFAGLPHSAKGGAMLNLSSNGLEISNLEASNAVVRIDLSQSQGWRTSIARPPVASAHGTVYSVNIVGLAGGQSNQPLGSLRIERQGTSVAVGADFTPLGAAQYVARFYGSNGMQIGSTHSNANLQLLPIIPDCPEGWVADCEWFAFTDTLGGVQLGIYICDGCLKLPDGTSVPDGPLLCLLTPVNPTQAVEALGAVEIRGGGGTLTLTSAVLRRFGLWHRFVGDAILENSITTGAEPWNLRVGNIGSSGEDGIETFAGAELPFLSTDDGPTRRIVLLSTGHWNNSVPVSSLQPDPLAPSWRLTATGRIQGSSNSFETLSDLTAFKGEQGTMSLSTRFDGLGVTEAQVDVFNAATLVGSTRVPVGTIGSLIFTGEVNRVGFFVTEIQTKCWRLTLNGLGTFNPIGGGPPLTGNFLRFGAVSPQANVESLHSLVTRAQNIESFTLRNATRPNLMAPRLRLQAAPANGGTPRFSWDLDYDGVDTIEFRDSLGAGDWQPLKQFGGAGGEITFEDPSPPPTTRFYRVRSE